MKATNYTLYKFSVKLHLNQEILPPLNLEHNLFGNPKQTLHILHFYHLKQNHPKVCESQQAQGLPTNKVK